MGLPLRSSDVVRARSAKASIACQNIASAVAVFERAILAVPIHTARTQIDLGAPRSLCALCVSETETYRCKSSGSHQIVRVIIFLHAGVSNNTKEAVAISICRGRLSSPTKSTHCHLAIMRPVRHRPIPPAAISSGKPQEASGICATSGRKIRTLMGYGSSHRRTAL